MNTSVVASAVPAVLVALKDGKPVTTSLIVAESFGKQHAHVLRDIDRIVESPVYKERCASNFGFTSALIPMPNGGHREERICEMDRQGFEILAMGFTGEEALRWKFTYSDAFAAMEAELRKPLPGAQPAIDPLAVQLAALLKGKVLVDYGTLGSLARVLYAASGLLKDVEYLGVDLEKQCGKPLIRFDLPASRPAPSRHTPLSRVQEDVLAQIRVSGRLGITTYELSRRPPACRLSSTDLHRVLATLEEQKKIILVNVRSGKPGKKREAWVALDPNETRQYCESEDR